MIGAGSWCPLLDPLTKLPAASTVLHLRATLTSGQCFRWRPVSGGVSTLLIGKEKGRVVEVERSVHLSVGESWVGVVKGMAVELAHIGATSPVSKGVQGAVCFRPLLFRETRETECNKIAADLTEYFRLNFDLLGRFHSEWAPKKKGSTKHAGIAAALRECAYEKANDSFVGLRLLNQDLHETIFQFLCSQNNHVKRIHAMVDKLAVTWGTQLGIARGIAENGEKIEVPLAVFPTAKQLLLAKEEQLRSMGFGYRSKFIVESAKQLCDSQPCFYTSLHKLVSQGNLDAVRAKLLALHGVGRKVCDCILLFGLSQFSVVPIDTHMAQLANTFFNSESAMKRKRGRSGERKGASSAGSGLSRADHDRLQQLYRDKLGEYCGWAHCYLFLSQL